MHNEERKLSRELGWIVGLGLLGVIAAYLIDPGPCEEPEQDQSGIFSLR